MTELTADDAAVGPEPDPSTGLVPRRRLVGSVSAWSAAAVPATVA